MMKSLPLRTCYSLSELEQHWAISRDDLRHWLVSGQLTACVWLPLSSVYEIRETQEGNRLVMSKELKHWEGYAGVLPRDCRYLLTRGETLLSEFLGEEGESYYRFPEVSSAVAITAQELMVRAEERERFANLHGLPTQQGSQISSPASGTLLIEKNFRRVEFKGRSYQFGEMQAAVLLSLYQSAQAGKPWQNGKQLLAAVGSQSFSLSNLFKRNPIWRELVESDGRGEYRLRELEAEQ